MPTLRKDETWRRYQASMRVQIQTLEQSDTRMEDKRFYASIAWRRLRSRYLSEYPLCSECLKKGLTTAAHHVHHIKPRKAHPELAMEWSNLKASCLPCHNAEEMR